MPVRRVSLLLAINDWFNVYVLYAWLVAQLSSYATTIPNMLYLLIISSKWHLDLATEWLHILYSVVNVFVRELPRSQEVSIGKTNEGFRAIPMNLRIRK